MNKKLVIGVVVFIVLFAAGIYFLSSKGSGPGKYDEFAQCLKDKGLVFYGTFWCPHCQNQKKLFGSSAQYLPYVECSTPDGQGQLDVCKEANIQSYPTWLFPDGTSQSGEIQLSQLAEKSSCSLPQ